MKNGKAVGPYSIPVYLLKILSEYIAVPVCDIINESLSNSVFPDSKKLVQVIPLYKKSSPEDAANYRPVSLLSVFSKIIEKLMHTRLYTFLEKYDILHSRRLKTFSFTCLTESVKKTMMMERLAVVFH